MRSVLVWIGGVALAAFLRAAAAIGVCAFEAIGPGVLLPLLISEFGMWRSCRQLHEGKSVLPVSPSFGAWMLLLVVKSDSIVKIRFCDLH